jgi:hypothetical protein
MGYDRLFAFGTSAIVVRTTVNFRIGWHPFKSTETLMAVIDAKLFVIDSRSLSPTHWSAITTESLQRAAQQVRHRCQST